MFEYLLSISDRSIAFNGFSKTVRNTLFSQLFYIIVWNLHKLRARIWSRKKKQQNRKHCEENHTTNKNTREISGFCFLSESYFSAVLRRSVETSFCSNVFWEIDLRRRDRNVKTYSWKRTAVIALLEPEFDEQKNFVIEQKVNGVLKIPKINFWTKNKLDRVGLS